MRDQSNLQQRQLYLQNLNLQQCILKTLQELIVTSASAGLATEPTLLSILNTLSTSQDFEILLVRDTGNGDLVVKQVTSYDANTPGAPVVTYETVAGAAYTPIGALEYLDPSSVMNLVLTELQTLNLVDFATETTLAALAATDFATEATLQNIETNTTGVARTPNFLRPTGVLGTVTAGTFSMSFASVGTANATVGGMTLKPGETLNFDAGALNNTLGAVAYDTTTVGSELIIITLT